MNIYEFDTMTPEQLRDMLGWSDRPLDSVVEVVMALCKHIDDLRMEVKVLKARVVVGAP